MIMGDAVKEKQISFYQENSRGTHWIFSRIHLYVDTAILYCSSYLCKNVIYFNVSEELFNYITKKWHGAVWLLIRSFRKIIL